MALIIHERMEPNKPESAPCTKKNVIKDREIKSSRGKSNFQLFAGDTEIHKPRSYL